MGICLATTSGKGGTGKSTISVGLGIAFARLNKSVLLVDLDEGLRCLDLMLGVDEKVVFDLLDVFSGRDISDAAYISPSNDAIRVIAAPSSLGAISFDKLNEFAQHVTELYDVIIFDFPAGMDFSLYSALPPKTQFIAVCNPDPVSIRDAAYVCDNIPSALSEPRLIINRFDISYIKSGIYDNIDNIIDTSGFRLLGIVPQDSELLLLPVKHTLKKRGRSQKALKRIALRLLGEEIRLPKIKKI